ncbi:MAG: hypothetical protein Q9167_007986 [Letrouitia subvulpina]
MLHPVHLQNDKHKAPLTNALRDINDVSAGPNSSDIPAAKAQLSGSGNSPTVRDDPPRDPKEMPAMSQPMEKGRGRIATVSRARIEWLACIHDESRLIQAPPRPDKLTETLSEPLINAKSDGIPTVWFDKPNTFSEVVGMHGEYTFNNV